MNESLFQYISMLLGYRALSLHNAFLIDVRVKFKNRKLFYRSNSHTDIVKQDCALSGIACLILMV